MARSLEEVRKVWLTSSAVHPRIVEYIEARVNSPCGVEQVDHSWRVIFEFYLSQGFVPERTAQTMARTMALWN